MYIVIGILAVIKDHTFLLKIYRIFQRTINIENKKSNIVRVCVINSNKRICFI